MLTKGRTNFSPLKVALDTWPAHVHGCVKNRAGFEIWSKYASTPNGHDAKP